MKFTYLDWAATAPPDPDSLDIARRTALEQYGNPSSLHKAGKAAAEVLINSRRTIASNLGCRPDQLYFTSGGSESNSIVFAHLLTRPRKGSILTSTIEHSSVWEAAETFQALGYPHLTVSPGGDGIIRPEAAAEKISPETELVSIMLVNNETGSVQDIHAIAQSIKAAAKGSKKPHIHTDAVQALGKMSLNLSSLEIDSASFSGHKIGAPRGIGLLYLKKPVPGLFSGGGQEGGVRPGTENLPGIAALAFTLNKRTGELDSAISRALGIREKVVNGLKKIPGMVFLPEGINPMDSRLSPFILKCSFPPVPGEVLQRVLNDKGVMVSTGSACFSNHKKKTNRVLKAMGTSPVIAESSIRCSWGPGTGEDEIDTFLQTAEKEITTLQEQLG